MIGRLIRKYLDNRLYNRIMDSEGNLFLNDDGDLCQHVEDLYGNALIRVVERGVTAPNPMAKK